MKTSEITAEFVTARATALKSKWGRRNSRMNIYEALYLMDNWVGDEEPDERVISVPLAWTTVEGMKSLLLTRPPVISVPASKVQAVATDRAEVIEKYLYAVWYQAQIMDSLNLAEFYASCLGVGVLRCVYDDGALEGELPLLVTAVDPRNVYPSAGPRGDLEVVYACKRERREIEAELGAGVGREVWAAGLNRPTGMESEEAWLDEDGEWMSYWRMDVEEVEEEVEQGGGGAEEQGEETLGALATLVKWAKEKAGGFGIGELGIEEQGGGGVEEQGGGGAGEQEGEVAEIAPQMRKVRRAVVTHCVVVDGQMVKKPVKMPGYKRLPFIRYAGIKTPLAGEDGALSVLFPITAGSQIENENVQGLAAATNELLTMKQQIIDMYASGALITDDDELEQLDASPGAINRVKKGSQWSFVTPPGPHPAIDRQMQALEQYAQDATVSASMQGRYVGAVSGVVLSAINNPVLMKIAHRQQQRERAYQDLNELILMLTEEYAGSGWYVWGLDRGDRDLELTMTGDQIGGYYRNRVQLSASLPRDEAGEVMSLASLVKQNLMSVETFLDQMQRIKSLPSQSPQDEMIRILRDKMLMEGPITEQLAKLVVGGYAPELAEALGLGAEGQGSGGVGGPPPGGPPGPPPGSGQGPMMGMPPSVVAPQGMPQASGAGGNVAAMMQMMGGGPLEGGPGMAGGPGRSPSSPGVGL